MHLTQFGKNPNNAPLVHAIVFWVLGKAIHFALDECNNCTKKIKWLDISAVLFHLHLQLYTGMGTAT